MIINIIRATPQYPHMRACTNVSILAFGTAPVACGRPSVARAKDIHLCDEHAQYWAKLGHDVSVRPYWTDVWFGTQPGHDLRVPVTGRATVLTALGVARCTYVANRGIVEFNLVGPTP